MSESKIQILRIMIDEFVSTTKLLKPEISHVFLVDF